MDAIEANRVIYNFMGSYGSVKYTDCLDVNKQVEGIVDYSESLDALVFVWDKMEGVSMLDMEKAGNETWLFSLQADHPPKDYYETSHGRTVQEAAAIATALAIKEIK